MTVKVLGENTDALHPEDAPPVELEVFADSEAAYVRLTQGKKTTVVCLDDVDDRRVIARLLALSVGMDLAYKKEDQ